LSALVLLAASRTALYADDDDAPLTAADVAGVTASGPAPSLASVPGVTTTRPTFTTPSVPPMDAPANDPALTNPAETQEIPQATPEDNPVAMVPPGTVPPPDDANNYMINDPDLVSGIGTAREFVAQGEESSPIGFEVRESRGRLKGGEHVEGLLIVKVYKGSPADKAGLRGYNGGKQHALQALAIGAGMAFPPAMLLTMVALPMIEYTEMGKSYDMIIGIDGVRVTNFFDFAERMRNVQPGELVYLNLVRNGKRIQLPVPVPALSTSASN
jgi:hypothetical protein